MRMGLGPGFVIFPPGTHHDVERAFRAVDRDSIGSIDERELQDTLSSAYHRFIIRIVHLLMFLFNNPASHSPSRMDSNCDFDSLFVGAICNFALRLTKQLYG
ncbi:hypothetical protein GUJ93_ZPchr0010g11269 [Zizania palustris]|uniref:EF-hand domain-containing protein n=1 Tax=Zizania palustris TaxID=103762 RepID=A0A8J5W9C8_ZIZPA|nr:hypothetical protein GUJ93_ZPchr0010g9865 [Zizania palustris]KAG8085950.1 hypothetical protein GUJ93_ZPchr0010g11269 [Zizania palustris]